AGRPVRPWPARSGPAPMPRSEAARPRTEAGACGRRSGRSRPPAPRSERVVLRLLLAARVGQQGVHVVVDVLEAERALVAAGRDPAHEGAAVPGHRAVRQGRVVVPPQVQRDGMGGEVASDLLGLRGAAGALQHGDQQRLGRPGESVVRGVLAGVDRLLHQREIARGELVRTVLVVVLRDPQRDARHQVTGIPQHRGAHQRHPHAGREVRVQSERGGRGAAGPTLVVGDQELLDRASDRFARPFVVVQDGLRLRRVHAQPPRDPREGEVGAGQGLAAGRRPRPGGLPLAHAHDATAYQTVPVSGSSVIRLSALHPDDAGAIAGRETDPRFVQHQGWSPNLARSPMCEFWHGMAIAPPRELVRLVATLEGEIVGYADLHGADTSERELGYAVGPSARWGQGLGTAVARAGLRHGFDELGLEEIWAEAPPANTASVRILERLGMRRTGTGEEDEFLGERTRCAQYRITRRDHARLSGPAAPPAPARGPKGTARYR